MRQHDWFSLEQRGVRRSGRALAFSFATRYHRLRIESPYPLPPEQAAVLVSNHTSYADPLFLQAGCPRLIAWMIAREYYDLPVVNWICRTIGTIPVDRDGRDIAAARQGMRALADGRVLGVFPEGRIETSRQLLPFQTGPAMLALRMRVPIVPACIEGTQRDAGSLVEAYLRPQSAVVRFGRPIHLEGSINSDSLAYATEQIRDAVRELVGHPSRAIVTSPPCGAA